MKQLDVIFVHVYLTEGEGRLTALLKCLHDEAKVRGVTVLRGISGFGRSGKLHSSSLLDMSLDLPLVVEFFDEPHKLERIMAHIGKEIEPGHVVSWPATLYV
ncbi:MAG: DUF190 domain-containing protein [Pseudomonadota bacterium]